MPNPFDDPEAEYLVLANDEEQFSLWPAFADVPPGWIIMHPRATRPVCLQYIEETWTDMRPASLRAQQSSAKNYDDRKSESPNEITSAEGNEIQ